MAIVFCGTHQFGQHMGDTITSIKAAWLMARNEPHDNYLLVLSRVHDLNFLWQKFIDTFKAEVIYDDFDPGNADQRFNTWNEWRASREIYGHKFDTYKEIYRRIDGGHRQGLLCGSEKGLGRKNVFEYFCFGQQESPDLFHGSQSFDGADLFYRPPINPIYDVYIAPYAKCQGNSVFTFAYWDKVTRAFINNGASVTVNWDRPFCDDLAGHPGFRKIFPGMEELQQEVCRHRVVTCGNTGIGWMAAACNVPLLAMQHPESHIADYRYEWCGVKSLIEFLEEPDADYCVKRIMEELDRSLVFTTGCYDLIHQGHLKHLEESASYGARLVVGLNSDASIRRLKGESRPVQNQETRAAVLRALRFVDEVIVFDEDNAESLIRKLRPGTITNGPDHKREDIVGRAFVENYGGKAIITGGDRTVSTTDTVKKITLYEISEIVRSVAPLSINPPAKLKELARQLLSVSDVDGHMADLGAYKGACSILMRRLASDRVLHVIDTWSGTPEPADPLCHHGPGSWNDANLAAVKAVLPEGENTIYHAGVFPDCVTPSCDRLPDFAFAFIDVDTYHGTRAALGFFWPRLVAGGKIMIDDCPDWQPCAGTEKAVREFFQDKDVVTLELPETHSFVVTKK
jgi:rfaE bifunctional protein nucleotidyltransferase chain/domain